MQKWAISILVALVIAASGVSGGIRAQEPDTEPYHEVMTLGRGSANGVAWSPAGDVIAVGGALGIWLYTPDLEDIGLLTDPKAVKSPLGLWRTTVSEVAFSPDGTILASAWHDGTIRLWDVATHQQIATLTGHIDAATAVAWSPDGQTLASGSVDNTVRVWDTDSGELLATLEGHTDDVSSLVWGADNTLFSGGYDATIRKWNIATGETTAILEGHEYFVADMALNPDGTRLISVGTYYTARVWDVATGDLLNTSSSEHADTLLISVSWSPDGERLAIAGRAAWGSGGVEFWDADTLEPTGTALKSRAVRHVVWSPDGTRLATVNWDNVTVWDAESGEQVAHQPEHAALVSQLAWSPDGRIIAAVVNNDLLHLWDTNTRVLQPDYLYSNDVEIGWSSDGRLVTTKYGDAFGVCFVEAIDLVSGESGEIWFTQYDCSGAAWSPDLSKVAVILTPDEVLVYDPVAFWTDSTPPVSLRGEEGRASTLAWSPDGTKLLTGWPDSPKRIYDVETGEVLVTLASPSEAWVYRPVWSPDGTRIAGQSGERVVIWDALTGDVTINLTLYGESFAWHPDGQRLAGVSSEGIFIWNTTTGELLASWNTPASAVDWSPDGKQLAVANLNGTITIWSKQ